MIVRSWLIFGILLIAAAWVLTVPLSPPPFQASPGSFADTFRAENLLPKVGALKISEEIGHEVFAVPETDAEQLAAMAAMGGMDMPGMTMTAPAETEQAAEPAMDMAKQMPAQPQSTAATPNMETTESAMPNTATSESAMPNMAASESAMPNMETTESAMPNMAASESAMPGMAMGEEDHGAGEEGQYGIAVVPAAMAAMAGRTIEIEMSEWGFKPARIDVAPGEVIRFVVRNKGKIPHEFMFMPATAMQAVNYRLERADWNLTEHEAIFEQSVVLPGDSLEATIRIVDPGGWMFMCMFPYHMQFGMMGAMMTEGVALPSMDMGGMKM